MKQLFLLLFGILLFPGFIAAQDKQPLDYATYDIWKNLEDRNISDNGKWVRYEVNPREGDGVLFFHRPEDQFKQTVPRGTSAAFSPSNGYAAFKIKPQHDTLQQMKRDDVPKNEHPEDSLGIYILEADALIKQARLISFKLPEEGSAWMAYMYKSEAAPEDTTEKAGEKGPEKAENGKDKDLHTLVITNPLTKSKHEFNRVKSYALSRNGALVSFVRAPEDSIQDAQVHLFNTTKETHDSLPPMEGEIKKLSADMQGAALAFIHSADTIDKKVYALHFWENGREETRIIADTLTSALPEKWTVSKHGEIYFARDNSKLYFGTAPKPEPEPKDTLLEEEKVHLDIWHYQDKRLQTEQLENRKKDLRKNYLAVYHLNEQKVVQLGNEILPEIDLKWHGNTETALGTHTRSYEERKSYESPQYADYYVVDVNSGKQKLILEETQNPALLSPEGKYALYYNYADSAWYSYDTQNGQTHNLTGELDVPFYNVEHDYPMDAFPYFYAGWTKDDNYTLLYDEFDIWKIDPSGKKAPERLTNGRENNIRYRYIDLNDEQPYISYRKPVLLSAFNEETKASGFASLKVSNGNIKELVMQDLEYNTPKKARKADQLIWTKSTVSMYPDLWISDRAFGTPKKLTDLNKQQEDYVWADVELIDYITADGAMEEALVYKPENFDPNKEYPMMVYFYRLHTHDLHRHYTPYASYSIINPLFYASNGYVVLIPNIRYDIGYPGESAFNHVIGATLQMANKPYINRKNIGVQGQSWGGYEIAYMVTRTDMFKAASPGAPVANMTSAYGGIRWSSGLVRQFQYEETQSRIGGSLWEKPLQYIENSPVFWADKINTPLLIRHDDADGAVPWYQGIELFNALRRFEKPAWLINYNDAPHNLTKKRANRKDWSKRMKQYFDHYLKGKPAPVWLKEGIPATKKGKTYGFELKD